MGRGLDKIADRLTSLLASITAFFIALLLFLSFIMFLLCGLGGGIGAGVSCCYGFLKETWKFWVVTILVPFAVAIFIVILSALFD